MDLQQLFAPGSLLATVLTLAFTFLIALTLASGLRGVVTAWGDPAAIFRQLFGLGIAVIFLVVLVKPFSGTPTLVRWLQLGMVATLAIAFLVFPRLQDALMHPEGGKVIIGSTFAVIGMTVVGTLLGQGHFGIGLVIGAALGLLGGAIVVDAARGIARSE